MLVMETVMKRIIDTIKLLVVTLVVGAMPVARAATTDTTTFSVTASIVADCNLSATDMAFGDYDASSGSPLDASSTVSVYCTSGTAYDVALNVGTGGGSFVNRTMLNGGNSLAFNLYTNAERTTVWGDGTASTNTASGTGVGLLTAVSHTVYGRIAIGQDQAPGSYASVVTVTVTY
jgi:spore coat protein U domain-containing protein, fimbrial subunit CupE1/2/3/6